MALAIVAAVILAFAFGREWILVKATGWQRLSRKYRCAVPFNEATRKSSARPLG
jgi:hypothetical protein